MKRIGIKSLIVAVALILVATESFAQDGNNTLYLLPNAPMRYRLNPSYMPEYNLYIGIPALGGVGVSYMNTSYAVDEILTHRKARWEDSLMVAKDSLILNIDDLYKHSIKNNRIMINQDLQILAVGVSLKHGGYGTIDISERLETSFGFGKGVIELFAKGNEPYIGKSQDLGKLNLDVNGWVETAIGYSRKIDDRWTVGGRFKILFGVTNTHIGRSKLTLTTDEDASNLRIYSAQTMHISAPLKSNMTPGEIIEWNDVSFNSSDISKFMGNIGLGIDLGAEWRLHPDWTLYASVTDIGFIRWRKNIHTMKEDIDFLWRGPDLSNSVNNKSDDFITVEKAFTNLTDSLMDSFEFVYHPSKYTTALKAKINFAATYNVCDKFNAGVLVRGVFAADRFYPTLTISGNARPLRNLGLSVSYSAMRGSPANLGFGLTGRFGPLQLYATADNLLAINYTHVHSATFRFGLNIVISPTYHTK